MQVVDHRVEGLTRSSWDDPYDPSLDAWLTAP
jgi:hypothetical protein